MLRLHASMTALVSNLVGVVSTTISGQTAHLSPQSSPPQPRLFTEPEVNTETSFKLPTSPPPKAAIKEEIHSDHTDERKEDNLTKERMKQHQFIQCLSEYIDERAAHYNRGRPTFSREPYPRVDLTKVNLYTKRNLPQPSKLPVHGCPQDPLIYPDALKPEGRIMECYKPTSKCSINGCKHKECIPPPGSTTTTHSNGCNPCFTAISINKKEVLLSKVYHPLTTTSSPFRTAPGYPTNLEVVAIPTCPVGGVIYMEGEGWIIHAMPG